MRCSISSGLVLFLLLTQYMEIGQSVMCVFQGWSLYGDNLYIVDENARTFTDSRAACQNYGGDLALIKTRELQAFIADILTEGHPYWIGLQDVFVEDRWQWLDGTYLDSSWNAWGPNEPNNEGNEDCVETTHLQWNDNSCSRNFFSICERQLEIAQHPQLEDVGRNYIVISWERSDDFSNEGDGPVIGYKVYVRLTGSGGKWTTVGYITKGETLLYNVTSLHDNTEYEISLSLIQGCTGQESNRGPILRTTTLRNVLPVLAMPPRQVDSGPKYVFITWSKWKQSVDRGFGPVVGYKVYIRSRGEAEWKAVGYVPESTTTTELNYNVSTLHWDTEYDFAVTTIQAQTGLEGRLGSLASYRTQIQYVTSPLPSTPLLKNGHHDSKTYPDANATIPWALFGVALTCCVLCAVVAAFWWYKAKDVQLQKNDLTPNDNPAVHTYETGLESYYCDLKPPGERE